MNAEVQPWLPPEDPVSKGIVALRKAFGPFETDDRTGVPKYHQEETSIALEAIRSAIGNWQHDDSNSGNNPAKMLFDARELIAALAEAKALEGGNTTEFQENYGNLLSAANDLNLKLVGKVEGTLQDRINSAQREAEEIRQSNVLEADPLFSRIEQLRTAAQGSSFSEEMRRVTSGLEDVVRALNGLPAKDIILAVPIDEFVPLKLQSPSDRAHDAQEILGFLGKRHKDDLVAIYSKQGPEPVLKVITELQERINIQSKIKGPEKSAGLGGGMSLA